MASAREYRTGEIRNIAVIGHGGSGKTTLVDALCFAAGTSSRKGNVAEGHALTMFTPEELKHEFSIQCSPAFAEHQGTKLNFLDTPGFLDFTGDTLAAVRVADAAIIVVSAVSGVEVGTERVWEYCEARGIPRVFYVSMMDKENANFDRVSNEIKEIFGANAVPVEIPIGEGVGFKGIINLFTEKARIYKPGTTKGDYDITEIPEELAPKFEEWETDLQETMATSTESLMEKYLEGEHLSKEEIEQAMHDGIAAGEVMPIFCGSAMLSFGMQALLTELVEVCPAPNERGDELGTKGPNQMDVICDDSEMFSALIFKTAAEPHVGELSFFKVMSGTVANGADVSTSGGGNERLHHLSIPLGKDRIEVTKLHAGDIGVVAKLKNSHTNDTLCDPERILVLEKIVFPSTDIAVAIHGETRADEDKLGEVLPKLHEEDPTFTASFNAELGQTIARGLGEQHLEITFERMKRKYGVTVTTQKPKIAYRETLRRAAEGQGRHKKQSGGRGQFGDCHIRLKPLPSGEGYRFVNSIKGGVIPGKYVPSVDKGIQEAAANGVLAGFPLVDFEAECYDGSYHNVDSSDIAFKLAGSIAFRSVAEKSAPVLLEPIMQVQVLTPDEYVGDVMGDITSRRGKVQGMDPSSGRTTIRAMIPEAELYKYAATLRSLTHGRGHHTRTFSGYEPMPDGDAKKVVAAARAAAE
jgi:elongation factor G